MTSNAEIERKSIKDFEQQAVVEKASGERRTNECVIRACCRSGK